MQRMVFINLKRLHADAKVPVYASREAAGMDLFSCFEVTLEPREVSLVGTGWAVELPIGAAAQIRPRSGMSVKNKLLFPNSVGTLDSDYRGELMVPLFNLSDELKTIEAGSRIAQLIVDFPPRIVISIVDELSVTERGSGGFGHTGK